MRARYILPIIAVVLIAFGFNCRAQDQSALPPQRLGEFERKLGPFSIAGQRFSVVGHYKSLSGSTVQATGSEQTLAWMEVRDADGKMIFSRDFGFEVENDHFLQTMDLAVRPLRGKNGSGLLVTYSTEPAPPLGGSSYQVIGIVAGKVTAFSAPISLEGDLIEPDAASEKEAVTFSDAATRADLWRFRVWTGNFFAIVPMTVEWERGSVAPALPCMQPDAPRNSFCRFEVDAAPAPLETDSSLSLYGEPTGPDSASRSVKVMRSSRITILDGAGPVEWSEDGKAVTLKTGQDVWLHLRIDGQEGWIHSATNLAAVGLSRVE